MREFEERQRIFKAAQEQQAAKAEAAKAEAEVNTFVCIKE